MKKIIKNNLLFFGILPFIIGIVTSFSLPPYNFTFINFITFPALLLIVFKLKEKKFKFNFFFIVGWLFGFGYFLSNIYWIVYSLTYDEIYKNIILFALILIPSFLAIFYGLLILLLFKVNIKKIFTTLLIFSLLFSILEYIRGSILSGFPWNLISYSWVSSINSIQILSLIGTYSFNLISITLFSLPVIFFLKTSKKIKINVLITLFALISINYIYGFNKINSKKNNQQNINNYNIKIVSPKIPIEKYIKEINEKEILINLIKLSNPNKNLSTIFIWPEGVLNGIYFDELKKYKDLFLNNFSKNHIIIMGINTHSFERENEKIYNSMIVIDGNLNLLAQYNKNKLVPFGEFLPLEDFFNKLDFKKITYGYLSFTKGKRREVIRINEFNFLPLICYEIIYSGNISNTKKDFDLIVNISEDGWFGDSIGPYQHFSHSIFRSIEEGKNILRSSNNGISAHINSNGIVLQKIESTQRGVIEIKSLEKTNKSLFSSVGNKMFFYFILFYIILIFFINKKEKE